MGKKKKILIRIALLCVTLLIVAYFVRIDRFGMAQISWVDCVRIHDVTYYANERTPADKTLIGERIGKVRFNVYDAVHNANYKFRNGDATFLAKGTELYSMKSDSGEIAVKINNIYYLYKEMK